MNNNQQYSPPSEWIMYELGVLPVFGENDQNNQNKILELTFFKARKDFEALLKTLFSVSHLLQLNFLLNAMFTTPFYSRRRGRFVNSAFPNKKHIAQKTKFIYDKKNESKCSQKFYVSSKQNKEWYRKTTPHLEQSSSHVSTSQEERQNKPFWL